MRGVSPPQANRELLRLFLQVVANVQLCVIADAVVDSRQPLPGVLVEGNFFDVVVAIVQVRVGVWQGENIHQRLPAWINMIRGDYMVGRRWIIADVVDCWRKARTQLRGGPATCSLRAQLRQFRWAKITVSHSSRRHRGTQEPGVKRLVVILEAAKKEQFVALSVEIRLGKKDGTADVAAWKEKLVRGLRRNRDRRVINPPIRVQRVIARAEVRFSMKIMPACFGD